MDAVFHFILVSSCVSFIGTVLYWVLLKKTTFFKANRFYLLLVVLLSLSLPFLPLRFPGHLNAIMPAVTEISHNHPISFSALKPVDSSPTFGVFNKDLLMQLFCVLIFTGILAFSFRFITHLFQILKIKKEAVRITLHQISFYNTSTNTGAFTFLRSIILNQSFYTSDVLLHILEHERIHIRERHYLDILLVEITKIIFWYNPANWLLTRFIKENIEYHTDRLMLERGYVKKTYQYSLLQVTLQYRSVNSFPIVNFNFHNLKNRIQMMNQQNTKKTAACRYLSIVALALPCFLFQTKGMAQATKGRTAQQQQHYSGQTVKVKVLDTIKNIDQFNLALRHLKMKVICGEFDIPFPFFQDDTNSFLNLKSFDKNGEKKDLLKQIINAVNISKSTVAFSINGKEVSPEEMQKVDWKKIAVFGLEDDPKEIEAEGIEGKEYLFAVRTKE